MLTELDAGMRVEGLDEAFMVPHRDGAFIGSMEISTWRSPLGDVDVLRGLPSPTGEVRFAELAERALNLPVDGQLVMVASLDDVIISKQTTNRPSDHDALPELIAISVERKTTEP